MRLISSLAAPSSIARIKTVDKDSFHSSSDLIEEKITQKGSRRAELPHQNNIDMKPEILDAYRAIGKDVIGVRSFSTLAKVTCHNCKNSSCSDVNWPGHHSILNHHQQPKTGLIWPPQN